MASRQAGSSGVSSCPETYEQVTPTQKTLDILALLPLRCDKASPDGPAIKLASDFMAVHYMSNTDPTFLEQFALLEDAEKAETIKQWTVQKYTKGKKYTKRKGTQTADPQNSLRIYCVAARNHLDPLLRKNPVEDGRDPLENMLANFVTFCALKGEEGFSKAAKFPYGILCSICFASRLPVAQACRQAMNKIAVEIAEITDADNAGSSSKRANKKAAKNPAAISEQYLPSIDAELVQLGVSPPALLAPKELDRGFFELVESLRRSSNEGEGLSTQSSSIVTTWRLHTHELKWDPLLQQAAREHQQLGVSNLGLLARLAEFLHVKGTDLIDFINELDKFKMKGEDDDQHQHQQWNWAEGTIHNPLIKEFFQWTGVSMGTQHRSGVNAAVHRVKRLLNASSIQTYRHQLSLAPLHQTTIYSLTEHTTALTSLNKMTRHLEFSVAPDGNVVVGHRDVPVDGDNRQRFSHTQIYDSSLNALFPFRDPANPTRVHPAFVAPGKGNEKKVAPAVSVKNVILSRQTENAVWELAGDTTSLNKEEFLQAYKQSLQAELKATMNNQMPPSSRHIQVVRLTEEQCETEAEKAALKGQYGVILKDNDLDNCPRLPHQTYGLFAGSLIQDDEDEVAYQSGFTDPAMAKQAAKDYGVVTPASWGKLGDELFPLGGGNDLQFPNCAFSLKPNGKLVVDETRCHAMFLPVTFTLTDTTGAERKLSTMNVVPMKNRPKPPYQIMLSYGPDYTLDMAQTTAQHPVKTEPQD